MPLTLITGPANAAKAGAVLERLRAALPHDPVLVVPTSADSVHYARELAGAGLVFGAEVTTFPYLLRDLARAAGIRTRPLGRLARAQVVRAAVADVELRALSASSRGPGFAEALGDLFAELQRSLATPARFGAAVRAWRDAGGAPAHAGELAALYSAYHARLEALETVDVDGLNHLALNSAREAWDGRPLFLYGFDELLPTQLDFVETLVRHTDTELTIAVTYEPGRAALAGSATTVELLKPFAREVIALQPRSEHYAQSARAALHHLERGLFEPSPRRVAPNGAVRLLEAGGERAEAELVGASVLELLRDGMAPEDIAVLVRGRPASELFAQVFDTYGIPIAHERRVPFAETRLGAGVLAFARASRPGGTAQDVVTWLRTPGKLAPAGTSAPWPHPEFATPRREAAPHAPGDAAPTRTPGGLAAASPLASDEFAPAPPRASDEFAAAPHGPGDAAAPDEFAAPPHSDEFAVPASADADPYDDFERPPLELFEPPPGGDEPPPPEEYDEAPPREAVAPEPDEVAPQPAGSGPEDVAPPLDLFWALPGDPAPPAPEAAPLSPAAPEPKPPTVALAISAPEAAVEPPSAGATADLADRLEVAVRRAEARSANEARRLWARLGGPDLEELDALASAESVEATLQLLVDEAEAIWTAPHTRRADVLEPEAEADARAARALKSAARELTKLAAIDPALVEDVVGALTAIEVRDSEAAEGAPGVLLADPLNIRARRFRAVFVCGLQEGELPQRPQPEPFLDDSDRAQLAMASGLVLPRHEDTLSRERSLFYACVSRPEEALFLSFRTSDEEGGPQQPSPFIDDVRALFTDELWEGRGRRLLAEVTWPPGEAPTPHELRRAQAARTPGEAPPPLQAPTSEPVRQLLASRDRESARGLETFAGCPVKWLVEHVLKPAPVDPDPEAMRRGSLGHAVLERTLRGLLTRTGSARLTPDTEEEALTELHTAITELIAAARTLPARAAARALQVDLERYIRHECATGAGYEPVQLEWSFDAYMLDGVAVSGRVDRVDTSGSKAIIRDYKGKTVHPGAKWAEDGKIQAALYALAVREQLNVKVVGALYQPIGTADQRPRGIVRDDVPGRYVNGDVSDQQTLEERLEESRAIAAQAAADLRAARIKPCPDRCGYQGGCAHPGICRAL
ncbi:PD-(D/E)XK nuclease family protein [Solirubrobacter sp. CPCC 204708]|uniref:PD-(D/E)XK nuclease family protein n=1 Tax=Solirubrobacter deserti TaxID=2282478 RepID=A0ABT4RT47_9ACTN|nr:PD-(D/E)XK nuclease family protein [Solirubrobacter deserti]MBE2318458.1 PD-(D/E)XK nuclease family protein [Solirubrobacter deserti]MDA0141768.1 PD-(D/E)XK nuclease family protein [Solirubrobacter deserti]